MTHGKDSPNFSALQSDYTAWLAQVVMSALYDSTLSRQHIPCPLNLDGTVPDRVRGMQQNLHDVANTILSGEGIPSRDKLESLFGVFEKLQSDLQRLDHGYVLADLGVDQLTGLRSQDVMMADLERELERRSRRGQPFCFTLSRIDGDEARRDPQNIVLAATCIQKTIRTFDDAYVTGEGEFLSSLKHSDINGGLRFVARLNEIVMDNTAEKFTLSSVVAEPVPGDDLKKLVADVRGNLDELSGLGRKGASGQYEEVSPLNKFIQSLTKTESIKTSE